MSNFLAEDFRSMVNKLNSYMAIVHEGDDSSADEAEIEPIKFNDAKSILKQSAEVSPTAKLHTVKLINLLTDGVKGKDDAGGKEKIIAKVIDILTCAVDDDSKYVLQEIAKLVNISEGDELAFDQNLFPKLVVELILLTGEIAQATK